MEVRLTISFLFRIIFISLFNDFNFTIIHLVTRIVTDFDIISLILLDLIYQGIVLEFSIIIRLIVGRWLFVVRWLAFVRIYENWFFDDNFFVDDNWLFDNDFFLNNNWFCLDNFFFYNFAIFDNWFLHNKFLIDDNWFRSDNFFLNEMWFHNVNFKMTTIVEIFIFEWFCKE